MFERLSLRQFRNHAKTDVIFTRPHIALIGPNGAGKTSVLEALYFLNFGKSWRDVKTQDLIQKPHQQALVKTETIHGDVLEIKFQNNQKFVFKNEQKIPHSKIKGQYPMILFCPEYLQLFSGTKELRHKFFDAFFSQYFLGYSECLKTTQKAHKNKTAVLKKCIREQRETSYAFEVLPWNQMLAENLPKILKWRNEGLKYINQHINETLQGISQNQDTLHLIYQFTEPQPIGDWFEHLNQQANREMAAQKNFYAASRDEYGILFNGSEIIKTASRGEERSALLSLLSVMIHLLDTQNNAQTILLLDDVFSELDSVRQTHLEHLCQNRTVFFTTTHKNHVEGFSPPPQIIEL